MKRGETCGYRNGNVLVLAWKDKRQVTMVSTYHDTKMEKVGTIEKGEQEVETNKSVCVLDYTKNMGVVDLGDHFCATYSFISKSLKWWRKLFFWCLEISIVNSYILYCSHAERMDKKTMTRVKYRRSLVEKLVGDTQNTRKRSHPG